MATYAVGDVHGQYDALMRLLETIQYADSDTLWFVGDLVNRGPKSLEVLRFISDLGKRAVKVLGNHDFSLLVQAQCFKDGHLKPFAESVLRAKDGVALLEQMRYWPLMHADEQRKVVMTHAGLYPSWSVKCAKKLNKAVMQRLQGKNYGEFLSQLYGDSPACWQKAYKGMPLWRFTVNAFCRMRYLDEHNCLEFSTKVHPKDAPAHLHPWFVGTQKSDWRQLFGHWASLGFYKTGNIVCLDSGAAWQGKLTAFDVDRWGVAGQVSVK